MEGEAFAEAAMARKEKIERARNSREEKVHWAHGIVSSDISIGVGLLTNRRVNIVSAVVVCDRLPGAVQRYCPGRSPPPYGCIHGISRKSYSRLSSLFA